MPNTDERRVLKLRTSVAKLENRTRSDILNSYRPSFVEGMARLVDFWGRMPIRRCRDASPQAAWSALHRDWETIGADLWKATHAFENDQDLDAPDPRGMKHARGG